MSAGHQGRARNQALLQHRVTRCFSKPGGPTQTLSEDKTSIEIERNVHPDRGVDLLTIQTSLGGGAESGERGEASHRCQRANAG